MIKDAVFFTEKQGRSDMLSLIVKNRSFNSEISAKQSLVETLVGFSRCREKNDIKKEEQGLRDLKPKCLLTESPQSNCRRAREEWFPCKRKYFWGDGKIGLKVGSVVPVGL